MTAKYALENIQKGEGTVSAPLYDDVIASDLVDAPDIFRETGNYLPRSNKIPYRNYTDPQYAKLEHEYMWKKSWQFACREEDLPNVGDCLPYDVGELSFIIVRAGEDKFHAFYNSCTHKGTKLITRKSHVNHIRCFFHGWQWNLDGSIDDIPAKWDFPNVDMNHLQLVPVSIDSWGGCLFINPDPDCGPLRDALGVLPRHFQHFDLEDRFTYLFFKKKIRCNWKVLFEGFLEAYHVTETHDQGADFLGDVNSRYDIFDDGKAKIGRFMAPMGVPSPITGKVDLKESARLVLEGLFATVEHVDVDLPEYDSIPDFGRKDVAAWKRDFYKSHYGVDCSHLSDAEMLDGVQYDMFPNFAPWLGEGFAVMYQFLPLGDNPNECVFCVRMTMPIAEGKERPPAAEPVELDFDDAFDEYLPEWGEMNRVYSQDVATLPMVQLGMKAAENGHNYSNLAVNQEQRCALLHEFVDEKIREGTNSEGELV